MGNSSSSHSFSKSRSASFSDLPYKLGNKSYTASSKHGLRASSIASTSPSPTQSSILRNNNLLTHQRATSLSSLADKPLPPGSKSKRASLAPKSSTKSVARQSSTKSLNEEITTGRVAQRQLSLAQPSGPRQYNDVYLQSDIKKLFKAHDKSNTKAIIVEDVDDSTAEGLDFKLATLKKQRRKGDSVDIVDGAGESNGTIPKKSRKSKKAPTLPSAPSAVVKPTLEVNDSVTTKKVTKVQRKKSAPAPPQVTTRSLSIEQQPPKVIIQSPTEQLPTTPEVTIQSTLTEKSSTPPVQELPVEINLPVDDVKDSLNSNDTNNNDQNLDPKLPNPSNTSLLQESEAVMCSTPLVKDKQSDLKVDITHPLSMTDGSSKPITVIERELTSSASSNTRLKIVPLPSSNTSSSAIVSNSSTGFQATDLYSDEHSFIEALTKKAVEDDIRESREIATQYNAPIDMAIQCDGQTLKAYKETEQKEKLGNILKLFIDKNAEKDAGKTPDVSSLDADAGTGTGAEADSILEDFSTCKDGAHDLAEDTKLKSESIDNKQHIPDSDTNGGQSSFTALSYQSRADEDCKSPGEEIESMNDNSNMKFVSTDTSENEQAVGTKDDISEAEFSTVETNAEPEIVTSTIRSAQDCSPTVPSAMASKPELQVTVDVAAGEMDAGLVDQLTESKASISPSNSNDSGHEEPSDFSSNATAEFSNTPPVSTAVTTNTLLPLVFQPVSKDPTFIDSKDANGAETRDDHKETKKQKIKFSSFHRITKTMRSFMSSLGRSPRKSAAKEEKHDLEPEVEDCTYSSDNWTLSDRDKKPVPRKEYHPIWDSDTITTKDTEGPLGEVQTSKVKGESPGVDAEVEEIIGEANEEVSDGVKEDIDVVINLELKDEMKKESNEEIKEEVNEKVKEEFKEESDEEVKEEVNEKVKEEFKEESDEEVKEEVNEKSDEENNERVYRDVDENEGVKLGAVTPEVDAEAHMITSTVEEVNGLTIDADKSANVNEQAVTADSDENTTERIKEITLTEGVVEIDATMQIVKVNTDSQTDSKQNSVKVSNDQSPTGSNSLTLESDNLELTAVESATNVTANNSVANPSQESTNDSQQNHVTLNKPITSSTSMDSPTGNGVSTLYGSRTESHTKMSWAPIRKRNSALELMTPRGYGATTSVYRPVSNPMVPTNSPK